MDLRAPIRALGRLIANWGVPTHPLDRARNLSARYMAYPGQLPGSRVDYATEAGATDLNAVVAAAVRWAIDSARQADFLVLRAAADQTEEPQWGHPLMDLIRRPGQDFTSSDLWGTALRDLIVDGNAYWHKVRSGSGAVVELEPMDSWRVEPAWPRDSPVRMTHYNVNLDSHVQAVPPEDMVHFRLGRDPSNDRKGCSPLRACLREICGYNEAETYLYALLKNGCLPCVVFSTTNPDHELDETGARVLKETASEKTGDKRFTPAVMTVPIRGEQFGFNPEQMKLDSIPNRFESTICANIGFNPIVLGLSAAAEHSTYANAQQHTRNAWERLQGYLGQLADCLTRQLLPEFEDDDRYSCSWNYDRVSGLREAMDALATRAVLLFEKGVAKQDECRELVGLEKVDPEGAGDRFWYEIQADAAAAAMSNPTGNVAGSGPPGDDGPPDEDEPDEDEVEAEAEDDATSNRVKAHLNGNGHGHVHHEPWSRY